jgi:hypothetical protein
LLIRTQSLRASRSSNAGRSAQSNGVSENERSRLLMDWHDPERADIAIAADKIAGIQGAPGRR